MTTSDVVALIETVGQRSQSVSIATGDGPRAVTAAIFWLKCRAGWKDNAPEVQDPREVARQIQEAMIEMDKATFGDGDPARLAGERLAQLDRQSGFGSG